MKDDGFQILKHWSSDFKDKYKTTFVTIPNNGIIDNYVVTKTVVSGMGLSWGSQYSKIKDKFGCFARKIPISKGLSSRVCLLNKRFLPAYLGGIELSRVSESAKERIEEYRKSFIEFVERETIDDDMNIFDSYIENGYEGMHKLVRDVASMNYLSGYERMAKIFHGLMISPDLSINELILSNEIHEIADYLSKNQFRLRN